MLRRPSLAALLIVLGSCTVLKAPAPVAVPIPSPPPAPRPQPIAADWRDWPLTPGDWHYAATAAGSTARFGPVDAALLVLRCDRAARTIRFAKAGAGAQVTVRTTSSLRPLSVRADGVGFVTVDLPAADPLFDAMGFSRGRFVIEQPGAPPLVVPAWAEILRVTEDCRG